MKKVLSALLVASSVAAPAMATEATINSTFTAPVSCEIDSIPTINLTERTPLGDTRRAGASTRVNFSQSGNTRWTLSAVSATSNAQNVSAQGSIFVGFPNSESLGGINQFDGQSEKTTVVDGAQDGELLINSFLFTNGPFVGGATYTTEATLTCVAE